MKMKAVAGAGVVGVALALAAACGPDLEPEKEKPKRVESRVGPCTTECNSMLDPECGFVTHPRFPQYASVDACVDQCAAEDSAAHWGAQEDGTDACSSEWDAYAECLSALSCDDNYSRWNDPLTGDYPCKQENEILVNCGYANASEAG
jgi:hypothetical protein